MLDFYEDINKYKNKNGNQECWINLVSPSEGELQIVSNKTGIPLEILQYPLDEDETSRINVRENIILIIIDIPFSEVNDNSLIYDTYPLGIVYTDHYLITICLKNSKIISDFFKPQSICTFEKTNLILQIVNNVYTYYSLYLKQINSKSLLIEKYLFKAVKNNQLLQLYSLRKSLVYFSTSLKSNELTLEKMLRLGIIKDEDNKELLSNILIEHKQTIEMTNMYNSIISNTMNFFSYIISNNLNIEMKRLSGLTILLSIPTIISGVFGMNILLPITETDPHGFPIVSSIIIVSCIMAAIILHKKDTF